MEKNSVLGERDTIKVNKADSVHVLPGMSLVLELELDPCFIRNHSPVSSKPPYFSFSFPLPRSRLSSLPNPNRP